MLPCVFVRRVCMYVYGRSFAEAKRERGRCLRGHCVAMCIYEACMYVCMYMEDHSRRLSDRGRCPRGHCVAICMHERMYIERQSMKAEKERETVHESRERERERETVGEKCVYALEGALRCHVCINVCVCIHEHKNQPDGSRVLYIDTYI